MSSQSWDGYHAARLSAQVAGSYPSCYRQYLVLHFVSIYSPLIMNSMRSTCLSAVHQRREDIRGLRARKKSNQRYQLSLLGGSYRLLNCAHAADFYYVIHTFAVRQAQHFRCPVFMVSTVDDICCAKLFGDFELRVFGRGRYNRRADGGGELNA